MNRGAVGDTGFNEMDIPGYEVVEIIGIGGFSMIFKAIQNSTGQEVAIKILKEEPDIALKEAYLKRFEVEMQIAARMDHPHIVRLLDKGIAMGLVPFGVFEYVSGNTLRELIMRTGALSPPLTSDLMGQTLDVLAYAHETGIVHRDLKPENILVAKPGISHHIKLLDFGISTRIGQNDAPHVAGHSAPTAGSAPYCAPEQLRGEHPSAKSDLYAWALILIECLTGYPLVKGNSLSEVRQRQMDEDDLSIPPGLFGHPLGDLLRKILRKNVLDRMGDARVIFSEFNSIDFGALSVKQDLISSGRPALEVTSDYRPPADNA